MCLSWGPEDQLQQEHRLRLDLELKAFESSSAAAKERFKRMLGGLAEEFQASEQSCEQKERLIFELRDELSELQLQNSQAEMSLGRG